MRTLRLSCLASLLSLILSIPFLPSGFMAGPANAQVVTVPDPDEVPRRRPPPAPRHPDCPKGESCTVCFAGCGGNGRPSIVYSAPTPPSRPVSKDPPIPNADMAGANRHPGSLIICGKEGTCRGFGMRDRDSYWNRGWHYNDLPSYPAYYPYYHHYYYYTPLYGPLFWW